MESDFNRCYYIYLCDNDKCRLFRQRQGVRSKDPEPEPEIQHRKATELPSYPAIRARAKENYRTARLLGIECREASKCRSQKRINQALGRAGQVVERSPVSFPSDLGMDPAARSRKRMVENV